MRRMIPAVAVIVACFGSVAWLSAQEASKTTVDSEIQEVVAEGVGVTADEALKDAFRSAVRQVVGAVVEAETLIENDEIVTDKVLTYSGGFVKGYEELEQKAGQGLIRIKIKAQVERKGVVERLRAANVKVRDIDGKGLFAEAITEMEREKNAAAMLQKALQGFPESCVSVTIVGKPQLLNKDAENATVSIMVQIEPNRNGYMAFVKSVIPVLEKLVIEDGGNGEFGTQAQASKGVYRVDVLPPSQGGLNYTFAKWMPKAYTGKSPPKGREATVLAVCKHAEVSENLEFTYYLLDASLQQSFEAVCARPQCKITLVDQDDELLASDRFAVHLLDNHPSEGFGGSLGSVQKDGNGNAPVFIAPLFYRDISSGYGIQYVGSLSFNRTITLSLDDLKNVHSAKAELVFDR